MKVELGGGTTPRGDGYINVDCQPILGVVDVVLNLETDPLPFPDDSVAAVYSSHCFEHIQYNLALREIVRVCRVGSPVEIRVPHHGSGMALCGGHKHVIPPEQVRHWCDDFPHIWFAGCSKRLRHLRTEAIPNERAARARELFPGLTDDEIMGYLLDCAHENRYFFEVVANG